MRRYEPRQAEVNGIGGIMTIATAKRQSFKLNISNSIAISIAMCVAMSAGCSTPAPEIREPVPVPAPAPVVIEPTPPTGTVAPTQPFTVPSSPVTRDRPPTSLNVIGPGNPIKRGTSTQWMEFEGRKREYLLHVPKAYDDRTPLSLVLMLHGRASSAATASRSSGLIATADRERFIAVFPEALGTPRLWNAEHDYGRERSNDTGYLDALIAAITTTLAVDPKRVFVIGHSSGGMMAYRLAASVPARIAGVAVIGGSIGTRDLQGRVRDVAVPTESVSILHVHGTRDTAVPIGGGKSVASGFNYMPAKEAIALWVKMNQCKAATAAPVADNITIDDYGTCRFGTGVRMVTLGNGNHDWPATLRLDPNQPATGTTTAVWRFFERHPRP